MSTKMSDREAVINRLCALTTNAAVLNALHACREGHPLGRNNYSKWRDAYSLCMRYPLIFPKSSPDMLWLERRAIDGGQ